MPKKIMTINYGIIPMHAAENVDCTKYKYIEYNVEHDCNIYLDLETNEYLAVW